MAERAPAVLPQRGRHGYTAGSRARPRAIRGTAPQERPTALIRDDIIALTAQALAAAQAAGDLPQFAAPEVTTEHPARPEHGDFSANLPLRIQGLAPLVNTVK